MSRLLLSAVAVALLAWLALAWFGSVALPDRSPISIARIEMLALAGFAAGAIALLLAWRAARRAKATQTELRMLTRSLDAALRDLAARGGTAVSVDEINRIVAGEIGRLGELLERHRETTVPPLDIQAGSKAAQHRAIQITAETAEENGPQPAKRDLERLVAQGIASGQTEISLQPIISLGRGAAVAFDVFAHFGMDEAMGVDIARIRDPNPETDVAEFERVLFVEAAKTARRQLTGGDAAMLYVPVSDALLASHKELAVVMDMIAIHPAIAQSVALCLPLESVAASSDVLDRFAERGVRIAAEASDDAVDFAALRRAGIRTLGLPTARLLGRRRPQPNTTSGRDLVEAAGEQGVTIIARDVRTDDDAIELIDLGLDLMSGERFSGPKRLRGSAAAGTQAAAE